MNRAIQALALFGAFGAPFGGVTVHDAKPQPYSHQMAPRALRREKREPAKRDTAKASWCNALTPEERALPRRERRALARERGAS